MPVTSLGSCLRMLPAAGGGGCLVPLGDQFGVAASHCEDQWIPPGAALIPQCVYSELFFNKNFIVSTDIKCLLLTRVF